jgi:TolA-binding protein
VFYHFEFDQSPYLSYNVAIMETKNNFVVSGCVRHVFACVGIGFLACALSSTAYADELSDELKFIDELQRLRMPDIAETVIEEARKRFKPAEYPDVANQLKVREIQGLLWLGEFAKVQTMVDAIKDKNSEEYWALVLAMADGYYAFQNYAEADKRYKDFFVKVDKPARGLVSFYRDSAYKYVQMLLYLNRDAEALVAYRYLFKIPLEEGVRRSIEAEVAELILKLAPEEKSKEKRDAMMKEAEALCDKLLWKQDIWFGKAIVMKAHVYKFQNDVKGAQKLVESYMQQLRIIHDALKAEDPDGTLGQLRMSPMPQCRYLLATLRMDTAMAEVKKPTPNEDVIKDMLLGERDPQTKQRNSSNGAYSQFINVFARYPESQWAFDAGEKVDAIRKLIKTRYNVLLKEEIKREDMDKLVQKQFEDAQLTFRQNQFKEAIEKYLAILNKFSESPQSVPAFGDLTIAYIELSSDNAYNALMAEAVTGHISERFCERPALMRDAGEQLRRIAEHYGEMKMEKQKRETYTLFFRDYPTHYAAGQLIMSDAEREFTAKNYTAASKRYHDITTIYTNSVYYYSALSRLAQIEKEEGRNLSEIQALELYVAKLTEQNKPSSELISGKFRLADAQREYASIVAKNAFTNAAPEAVAANQAEVAKWLARAIASLTDITKRLNESPASYFLNAEEKKRNEQIKEAATFTRAICLTQIQQPADKLADLRKAAIKAFEAYVKDYPQGKYAARAQMQIGTLYTILQDVPNAQAAFEKLSKDYPGSDEAKNSIPELARSLIEMGFKGEGVAKYRQMFAASGKYTDGQFLAAGKALEDAREFDLALQSYEKAMSLTKDKTVTALAKLGKARTLVGQKRFSDAYKMLLDFTKEYAKLQVVVDANMLLIETASELGKAEKDNQERKNLFNSAIAALSMVKGYTKDPAELKELDLKAGEILVRKMQAEKALGLNDQAVETRGHAIVAFTGISVSIDPNNAALANVLEKAYYNALPLMVEHKLFEDVILDGEKYLKQFPNGKYRTDVQSWVNQAKITK